MAEDQSAAGSRPDAARAAESARAARAAEAVRIAQAAEELWGCAGFREGLAGLAHSTQVQARQFAVDMRLLAELARRVPRSRWDERGSSPWISFQREVALARSSSDQAAQAEIRAALRLTGPALATTMGLLEAGRLTVPRARVLIAELEHYDDQLTALIDAEVAERAAGLPAWRIRQEVRRAAVCLDPDAAAARVAAKNTDREVTFTADDDDQASVLISGPAVPLTRWYSTLDAQARALKQAGDPRTLAQLRFDLATSTYPCTTHRPADTTSLPTQPAPPQAEPADAAVDRPVPARPDTPPAAPLPVDVPPVDVPPVDVPPVDVPPVDVPPVDVPPVDAPAAALMPTVPAPAP
ncbi:MAG: hypothetical protein WD794_10110, partial [Mycobacteriales bacterium]